MAKLTMAKTLKDAGHQEHMGLGSLVGDIGWRGRWGLAVDSPRAWARGQAGGPGQVEGVGDQVADLIAEGPQKDTEGKPSALPGGMGVMAPGGMGVRWQTPATGLFQVTVLEAKGNVGSRIEAHCIPRADWYIELGAMRIPGNHRLSSKFIWKSELNLTEFCPCINQTWVLVNRVRQHLGAMHTNPDLLGYSVRAHEAGKMAEQLLEQSLMKVEEELKGSSCCHMLEKFNSFSTKQMIWDLLNTDSGYYAAFKETLRGFIFFHEPWWTVGWE
ncbi:L-amino-acid oxidase [Heterocephalus glaber]|uniref:L-amino-acid oxidase n=1 Tax=Heterocephalus glaber TaxID=10181 RepID=G5BRH3_HETGA|nr:L-amino-acid oxidase [Heterocephalus glaber]